MLLSLLPTAVMAEGELPEELNSTAVDNAVQLRWNEVSAGYEHDKVVYTKYKGDENVRLPALYYDVTEDGTTRTVLAQSVFGPQDEYYALYTPEGNGGWSKVGTVFYAPGNPEGTQGNICWTLSENEWTAIGEGCAQYLLMIKHENVWYKLYLRADATPTHGDKVKTEDIVEKGIDTSPVTQFPWNDKTYYLGLSSMGGDGEVLLRPQWSGVITSEDNKMNFNLAPQVFRLKENAASENYDSYEIVGSDILEELKLAYDFSLTCYPTASCEGHYYPLQQEDNGRAFFSFTRDSLGDWVIEVKATPKDGTSGDAITHRGLISIAEPEPDQLQMWCHGLNGYTDQCTLRAGTYSDVELRFGDNWLTNEDSGRLSCDGNVVKNLSYAPVQDGNETIKLWKFTVDESGGSNKEGWIKYSDENGESYVAVTVKPSHGAAVADGERIQASQELGSLFVEAKNGLVAAFKWPVDGADKKTYYLATAEWEEDLGKIVPYGMIDRSVNSDGETYFAARVFDCVSGTPGSGDATYLLREDIRQQMQDAGYSFELETIPTTIGCKYYPAIEKDITLESRDPSSGNMVSAQWEEQYFTEDSIGRWVYQACIMKNNELWRASLSMGEYDYNLYTEEKLNDRNVDAINKRIAEVIKAQDEELGKKVNGLYGGVISFILPEGEIEGQIIVPDTRCNIRVRGASGGDGVILTTLRGGIEFRCDMTCHVENIHFIGAGKNAPYWDAQKGIGNYAVYGIGQGTPESCIFEKYYIVLHSTERPSWGGAGSVFLNNNVAICQNSENGGQLSIRNNWFVGNNIGVLLKNAPPAAFLLTYQNRFVNNGTDITNESLGESRMVLWASQNYFYHNDANEWKPQLWTENNGVIRLNYDNKGRLYSANGSPSFAEPANFKNSKPYDGHPAYEAFLPRFGGWTKTMAYPLAKTVECDTFFYPGWWGTWRPMWDYSDVYPIYVPYGKKIEASALDGLHVSSFDGENAVGTFDFTVADDGMN